MSDDYDSDNSIDSYEKNIMLYECFNTQTVNFIQNLSFINYKLAGNSVANMIEGIKLQGDLDFWCSDF